MIKTKPNGTDDPVKRSPSMGGSKAAFDPWLRAVMLSLMVALTTHSVHAMNWEGHDDWMIEQQHAKKLLNSAPHAKPLTSAFPSCQERAEKHARNPYEQRPIPGVNCLNENDTQKSITE